MKNFISITILLTLTILSNAQMIEKDRGFIGKIIIQYGTPFEKYEEKNFSAVSELGYKFNKIFSLTQGLGVLSFEDQLGQLYPLYIAGHFNMTKTRIQPYASISLGTCLNFDDYFDRIGLYTSFKSGVNLNLQEKGSVTFFISLMNFGYHLDLDKLDYGVSNDDSAFDDCYHALTFGVILSLW